MSTSGGSGGGGSGLSGVVVHATGDTLDANMYNLVTSGGTGAVNLPNAPAAGTQIYVRNTQTVNNGVVTVTPQGGATVDGSPGLNLSMSPSVTDLWCWLIYDGANWKILDLAPGCFSMQLAVGGYAGTMNPEQTFQFPRSTVSPVVWQMTATSGAPLLLTAGNSNIDMSFKTPRFSAGTMFLSACIICISAYPTGVTNAVNRAKFTLTGIPVTLASFTTYNPGNGMNDFTLWTLSESAGTDIVIHTGNQALDSTGGFQYGYSVTATFKMEGLVP